MNRYLLDTNHLSAYLDRHPTLELKVDGAFRRGDRVGVCLPVLCEYRAGIRVGRRFQKNLTRLETALSVLRIWPLDEERPMNSVTFSKSCAKRDSRSLRSIC